MGTTTWKPWESVKIKIYKARAFWPSHSNMSNRHKALYWILTIPQHDFTPYLPAEVHYLKGQLEEGGTTGYLHWQLLCTCKTQLRLKQIKTIFGESCHAEPSRSSAADDYVWKEETRIAGTQFELGERPFKRNSSADWASILEKAKTGMFQDIPPDILVRYYSNIKRICVDNAKPVGIQRLCKVFWGPTGTGKSRTAWAEAGLEAYPKGITNKYDRSA